MNDSIRERLEQLLHDVTKEMWKHINAVNQGDLNQKEFELATKELVKVQGGLAFALKEEMS
jgi:predicted translin family RNA/ssDNA-binding protein